jgi:hypothetical protein
MDHFDRLHRLVTVTACHSLSVFLRQDSALPVIAGHRRATVCTDW